MSISFDDNHHNISNQNHVIFLFTLKAREIILLSIYIYITLIQEIRGLGGAKKSKNNSTFFYLCKRYMFRISFSAKIF